MWDTSSAEFTRAFEDLAVVLHVEFGDALLMITPAHWSIAFAWLTLLKSARRLRKIESEHVAGRG
jgi:hypothetical protein